MVLNAAKSALSYISMIILGAKSHFKTIMGMALGAFAAPLIITAIFAAAGPVIAGAFSHDKLNLIFCDLEGSGYLDTLLNILLSDESIMKTMTSRKLDYDESLAELAAGNADAVIVFPESFVSDMARGINNPVKIIGNESDPVRTVFIREFMQSAAAELSAAQSAINTVWFHMDLQNMGDLRRNMAFTSLTFEYTSKAFARSIYYTFQNVAPPYKGSSPATHIISALLAALVFFGALPGIRLVIRERGLGISTRLAAFGVSSLRAAFYHFAPIYLRQLLCASLAAIIAIPAASIAVAAMGPGIAAKQAAYYSPNSTGATSIIGSVIGEAIGGKAGGETDGGETENAETENGEIENAETENGETANGAGSPAPAASAAGNPAVTAISAGTPPSAADGIESPASAPNPFENAPFKASDIPKIVTESATPENAMRLLHTIGVLGVLCFFTAALSLFAGCAFHRAESAELLVVTLGIAMAIAGGTLIPYPFLPDGFRLFGPFSFNKWAQDLIASALYGGSADYKTVLAVFTALAAALLAASACKIKADNS